jgi:hypothetical protein
MQTKVFEGGRKGESGVYQTAWFVMAPKCELKCGMFEEMRLD